MLTALKWGGNDALRERLEAMGEAPPPTPEVEEWVMWVWSAWQRLSQDRPWRGGGMGPMIPGQIPWQSVRDWCHHRGRSADDVDFADQCIQAMDGVYINWYIEKLPKS